MKLVCPECKNEVELAADVAADQILECNHCGITLQVTGIAEDGMVSVEITDEGK